MIAPPSPSSSAGSSDDRGVALLIVLFVIALVGTIGIETQYLTRIDARIAANVALDTRYGYLAESGIEAARVLLREDRRDEAADHLLETWSAPIAYPVEDSLVQIEMIDEERKLPINALLRPGGEEEDGLVVDEDLLFAFETLLANLELEPGILSALVDWVDPDDRPYGSDGAELYYYERLSPSYPAKDGPMDTLAELKQVKGIDPESFQALSPHVTVYGSQPNVNINTASLEVLKALIPEADDTLLEELITRRFEEPFETRAQINEYLGGFPGVFEAPQQVASRFSVASKHFTIRALIGPIPGQESSPTAAVSQRLQTAVVRRGSEGETTLLYWRAD